MTDRPGLARPALEPRLALAALCALYLLVYGRAVGFGFVWDDEYAVVNSPLLERPLGDALRATMHDYLHPELGADAELAVRYESYRPLLWLSYKLDDRLFARSAAAMHAHNLLLGLLCIGAVWALARRLLPDPRAALGVTALFALHPLQVEALCYVSARSDLLASGLALGSALAVFRSWESSRTGARIGWTGLGCLAYLASLTAKEAAGGLPLALALLALAQRRGRGALLPVAAQLATAASYLALRALLVRAEATTLADGAAATALLHLPGLALQYLGLLVAPTALSIERLSAAPALAVAGWIFFAAVAGVGLGAALGRLGAAGPPVLLACAGLGWLPLLLGPSAVAVETTGVAADRYAYLASFGPLLAGAALAAHAGSVWRTPALAVALTAWALLLLGTSVRQVGVWRDEETLYSHSLAVASESPMAHYRAGVLRAEASQWPEAAGHFERALERDPELVPALNNLSLAYLNLGRPESAGHTLQRALALSGERNFRAWNTLAALHFGMGRRKEGCAAVARALAIQPRYATARQNQARFCGSAAAAPGEAPRG